MSLTDGLVQLYTGDGKGKTSAALGLALRGVGQGLAVCVVQLAKSIDVPSGEVNAARQLGQNLEIVRFGDSSVWGGLMPARRLPAQAKDLASLALQYGTEAVFSGSWDIVVLDEICVAIELGLVDEDLVLSLIDGKPREVELVLTGRGASERLIDACDLVTEMREVKHPATGGSQARRGIDY